MDNIIDGFFSAISSSSKASGSEYYARFRFFDLTKNKLITNIRYFENAALVSPRQKATIYGFSTNLGISTVF